MGRLPWQYAQELVPKPIAPTSSDQRVPNQDSQNEKLTRPRTKHQHMAAWEKKVKHLFETKHNTEQFGPWDPYSRLKGKGAVRNEDVKRFFNGFDIPMGNDKLVYRQRFASWAIGEALKDYLPGHFNLCGEVMQNERVTYHVGHNNKELPKNVVDVIRADGQYDIDAEDPIPPSKKNDDLEISQSVSGAAQALISGSRNSLGPPIQPCATYLQMDKVGTYGRKKLGLWNSPLFPEVKVKNDDDDEEEQLSHRRGQGRYRKGMAKAKSAKKPSKGFLDSQITGIVWILSRLLGELPKLRDKETLEQAEIRRKLRGPKYGGALLADSMGLGKTLTAIATIELMARRGLNVEINPITGRKMHCPILILCPTVTVAAQWVEEILQSTCPESVSDILVGGASSNEFPHGYRVHHLSDTAFNVCPEEGTFNSWPISHSYVWDMDVARASKTVIILPIHTWALRTCYRDEDSEEPSWRSLFTDNECYFSIVCVDEAHKVKNASTKLFRSVSLLLRQYTLLITATPCLNTLTDLLGPAMLLWDTAEDNIERTAGLWDRIEGITDITELDDLEGLEPHDALRLAAGRPSLLSRLICKDRRGNGQDIASTRKYLRYFESLAMLKRGPSSIIFEDFNKSKPLSLEGLFPVVDNWTVDIDVDQESASQYQFVHLHLLLDYFKLLNNWTDAMKNNKGSGIDPNYESLTALHRQWQIASSSMDVWRIDTLFSEFSDDHGEPYGTMASHIWEMRRAGVTFRELAKFLLGPGESTPKTALDYLKIAVRGSPILRYILHDLKENVLPIKGNSIKKLLITEAIPITAYYIELVLQFIGINARVLHAKLKEAERKELVASFNDSSWGSVQVLIQMYTVGVAGTNLHKSCSRVIVASQARSLPVQSQAVHRVIRVGQTQDVQVFRLKVTNSYHAFLESRQIEKILPELSARAQGEMNTILVQLLNIFQREVDEAWNSDEGQKLIAEKNLIISQPILEPIFSADTALTGQPASAVVDSKREAAITAVNKSKDFMSLYQKEEDPLFVAQGDVIEMVNSTRNADKPKPNMHVDKKRKLDMANGLLSTMPRYPNLSYDIPMVSTSKVERDEGAHENLEEIQEEYGEDEDEDEEDANTSDTSSVTSISITSATGSQKRPREIPGFEGWFRDDIEDVTELEAFLALKPRREYYEEFKRLPKTKKHFDHRKNQLRRLLSFRHTEADGHTSKPWNEEDLNNVAVLERGLELMLRVRHGANHIDMLPFPHINFSDIDPAKLIPLQHELAKLTSTDHEVEALCVQNGSRRVKGDFKELVKGIDTSKSLSEIDKQFADGVNHGSNPQKKPHQRLGNNVEQPSATEATVEEQDDGGDHVEVEDPCFYDIAQDDMSISHLKDAGTLGRTENKVEAFVHQDVDMTDATLSKMDDSKDEVKKLWSCATNDASNSSGDNNDPSTESHNEKKTGIQSMTMKLNAWMKLKNKHNDNELDEMPLADPPIPPKHEVDNKHFDGQEVKVEERSQHAISDEAFKVKLEDEPAKIANSTETQSLRDMKSIPSKQEKLQLEVKPSVYLNDDTPTEYRTLIKQEPGLLKETDWATFADMKPIKNWNYSGTKIATLDTENVAIKRKLNTENTSFRGGSGGKVSDKHHKPIKQEEEEEEDDTSMLACIKRSNTEDLKASDTEIRNVKVRRGNHQTVSHPNVVRISGTGIQSDPWVL
ncbi:hypothetical protein TruAng_002992 [Truncatella angustata]|nr:hypothetical protein TruAng_002992 [Truncatella angustata]